MKSLIVAAVATFALGGAALAESSTGSSSWTSGGAAKATPVAAETCAGAKASYQAAMKAHATSPNMKAAEAKAKSAAKACKAGETSAGVADYDAATKLLGS